MLEHECKKSEIIDCIKGDLKEIKTDLKDLVKFKAQAIAIITVISGSMAFVFNIILK